MRLISLKNLLNQRAKTKQKKAFENAKRTLKGKQNVLNCFESKIFPIGKQTQGKRRLFDLACVAKVSDRTCLKILTPK